MNAATERVPRFFICPSLFDYKAVSAEGRGDEGLAATLPARTLMRRGITGPRLSALADKIGKRVRNEQNHRVYEPLSWTALAEQSGDSVFERKRIARTDGSVSCGRKRRGAPLRAAVQDIWRIAKLFVAVSANRISMNGTFWTSRRGGG
jgi:hypothetical protein